MLEDDLRSVESNGYVYAIGKGREKEVLFRAYGPKWRWLYQARRVAQQTNAAGGAVIVDITVNEGIMAELVQGIAVNSGNNTLGWYVYDEDNVEVNRLAYAAAAATNYLNLPTLGNGVATGNYIHSLGLKLGPGVKLSALQANAGVQNDTLTSYVSLLLPISAASDGSDITWSVARSTNAGDVTLAASTISTANTMQAVLLP